MQSKKFRKDINALRALSVVIVVLFHFKVPGFSSGFMGVDIFFAISGYLMTSIICKGIEKGSFNILQFYKARFDRLYPALGMMLIIVLLTSYFTLTTSDYLIAGKNALSSALFISNIYFYMHSGYFDQSSMLNLFLHTWSLSVEWQFYLFFPAILIASHRLLRNTKIVIITLFLASLIISFMMNFDNKDEGYFLLHTRAWELLAGGIAYFIAFKSHNAVISVSGWIIIILSITLIPETSLWPGSLAFFPVFGACLILSSGFDFNYIFSNKIVINLGLWSYSIYLWHWPIVVALYMNGLLHDVIYISCGLLGSVILGYFSYKYIESFRFSKSNSKLGLTYFATIIIAASAIIFTNGFKFRLDGTLKDVLAYKMSWVSQRNGKCFLDPNQQPNAFEQCPDKTNGSYTLIWGDSHAAQLIPGFKALNGHEKIVQRTSSLCIPAIGVQVKSRPHCKVTNDYILNEIKQNPPQKVILAASWTSPSYNGIDINPQLVKTVNILKKIGIKEIYIIGTVPVWKNSLPKLIETFGAVSIPKLEVKNVVASSFITDENMRTFFNDTSAKYISLIDIMCKNEECQTIPEGFANAPMQWDNAHLTEPGSNFVVSNIIRQLH